MTTLFGILLAIIAHLVVSRLKTKADMKEPVGMRSEMQRIP